ncbi:carbohydrate esterase family 15 protein [Sphaerobolus stellatus SS14]|nr:carbohydrate esterase family 15 protein [Sphaerobolus stellatus SS14]
MTVSSVQPTSTQAACPTLPTNPSLKSITKLPDPFTFFSNGNRVTTKADWSCRLQEISQLFQKYELGTVPPKPQSVTGSLSGSTLTINVTDSGRSISFTVGISTPSGTSAPYPGLIAYTAPSIPTPASVSVFTTTRQQQRGKGKFYTLYGSNHSVSTMMAWAWGVSRSIDALETPNDANIDLTKLAVTGCSRNDKGALVARAFEERIALTIPQESGSGGAGCWGISDAIFKARTSTQTASEIVDENVNAVPSLPIVHYLLAGLVAPRVLLIIDDTGIDWLGPKSVFGCMKTANQIYQALGIPEKMGVSQVGNHNYCAFPSSEQGDLDAYINKFLKGQNTNTTFVKTDGNLGFNDADWVDWTVPTLT